MTQTTYAAALVDALRLSMEEDLRVMLVGSAVLGLGPQRGLMDPIRAAFADRIFDPPTAEAALVGLGIGAAMAGARPFIDIGTATFVFVGWSPLVNEAAVAHSCRAANCGCRWSTTCCMGCAAAAPRSIAAARRR